MSRPASVALWRVLALLAGLALAQPAAAQPPSVERAARAAGLRVATGKVRVNGVTLFFRDIGGGRDTLILLHGFPETGDAFAPAVAALGARHRLIIPDLRGFGRSDRPGAGYDTKTVATDVKLLADRLGVDRAHVVGHDIGARVAYAFALQYPARVRSLTVGESFIEGLSGTEQMKLAAPFLPRLKHFQEYADPGQAERRHLGSEDELVLSFMNSRTKARRFTADDVSDYVASFRRDRGMWAAFKHYEAFDQDAAYVQGADASGTLGLPVLTIGCAEGSRDGLERQIRDAGFKTVRGVVFKDCSHWIFEENPTETVRAIEVFLAAVG